MLTSRWGTDELAARSMTAAMICVRLPGADKESYEDEHNDIQDRLHFEYKIEVPIKVIRKRLYVRLSAHIYNTKEDYQRLADAILIIRPPLTIVATNSSSSSSTTQSSSSPKSSVSQLGIQARL
jgi:DNA primase large subunit